MRHNLALGLSLSCIKEADDCNRQSISTMSLDIFSENSLWAIHEDPLSSMGSVIVPESYVHSRAAMTLAYHDINVGSFVQH